MASKVSRSFLILCAAAWAQPYSQQVSRTFTTMDGLPSNDASAVVFDGRSVFVSTSGGPARFENGRWVRAERMPQAAPQNKDARGRLWSTGPAGLAVEEPGKPEAARSRHYHGADGLPSDEFTGLAAGGDGVWLATGRGAIHFDGKVWEYRQGRRWLPDDGVRGVAVDAEGSAWFATAKGVARISEHRSTLERKAEFFENEIDARHRRTLYQYVLGVTVARPGEKGEWRQHDSDNDGLWTAMYGAGECFAYAATRDPKAKQRARRAFEALRFLQTVTQGGTPAAPPGAVARTILPADGEDPNAAQYTREKDEKFRAERDSRWKVLVPRWPKSADGKWFWKADTSSDELDGHFFFHALYYDLVAETEAEKREARAVVAAIADHLIAHDFTLVDWDGLPTRWGIFGPKYLNEDPGWAAERGLNSLSILTYLKVAGHMTGDPKYEAAYRKLVREHHYAMNAMTAKVQTGPGTGNQSDDEMAMMGYYNLLRYEKDPVLRSMYLESLALYWDVERFERNPFFHFVYAAHARGASLQDNTGRGRQLDPGLGPGHPWIEDSLDTLRRFPLDRFNWSHTNSQRLDVARMDGARAGARGRLRDGRVLPVDERFFGHWNHDPYTLDTGGDGRALADGAAFLLPYYMGRYHGFVK